MFTMLRWFILVNVAIGLLAIAEASDKTERISSNVDNDDVPGVEPLGSTVSSERSKEEFPSEDERWKDSNEQIDGSETKDGSSEPPAPEMPGQPSRLDEPEPTSSSVDQRSTTESNAALTSSSGSEVSSEKSKMATVESSTPEVSTTEEEMAATESTSGTPEDVDATDVGETISEMVPISRGRALNISATEMNNSLHANLTDLSDVSMDDEYKEIDGGEYNLMPYDEKKGNGSSNGWLGATGCTYKNETFAPGMKVVKDCEEKCICGKDGTLQDCGPVCTTPFFRAGRGVRDPFCQEKLIPDDPCCATMVCAEDSEPEPEESCTLGNATVTRGESVEDGCSRICICEAQGKLKCRPRCPPNETAANATQNDRCIALADPKDHCCSIILCDVTHGEHEIKPESTAEMSGNLTKAEAFNSTAIKLTILPTTAEFVTIGLSTDSFTWKDQKVGKDGIVSNLEPAHAYYVRLGESGRSGPVLRVTLPAEVLKVNATESVDPNACTHRGKSYQLGEEWYDECISYCACSPGSKVECATIECPTDFGLDVLDAHCLEWEMEPDGFIPKAPLCCPQEVRCKYNGSCVYEGETYPNWSEIPTNVTGCEKRCYCEMGNVTCQAACPPVSALPPQHLQCPPNQAALSHLPGDECCVGWMCADPQSNGRNVTPPVPGPLATDSINQLLIDDSKTLNNETTKYWPSQSPDRDALNPSDETTSINSYPDITNHELFHYPMDPGHPTVPYNGPYNPDFKPTPVSVEQIFHLPSQTKEMSQSIKDKSKSKSESKKPIEPVKPQKEPIDQEYVGPLAPGRKPIPSPIPVHPATLGPSKLPPPSQNVPRPSKQPPFDSWPPQDNGQRPPYPFAPNNGDNIPQFHFQPHFDNPGIRYHEVSPPSGPGSSDPNLIAVSSQKKKNGLVDPFFQEHKPKPLPSLPPGRVNSVPRDPSIEQVLPEDLYHLINSQHPGLIHLNENPPEGHHGLYGLHREISGQKKPIGGQSGPPFNFQPVVSKKPVKPQIFAHKGEDGETTYHVHTAEIPNTPEEIEALLLHINEQDPNPGPFQRYPAQPPIVHNTPNNPLQNLPPHLIAHLPQNSGLTRYNHPFPAQIPNQSGSDPNLPPGFHQGSAAFPPRIPGLDSGIQSSSNEVTVQKLEAVSENTVRLAFTVPRVLVGLHGSVEVQYTNDRANPDPATWKSQAFVPPDDLIATPQLEFELDDLEPATEYKVKITVKLRDLANSPTSKIYTVQTLDKPIEYTTLPPQIPIDAELMVAETNSTWVNVMWKKFTEYELQFIDGVQLRYKELDGKVYAATPLIHRAVTSYLIENLKPATSYEVGIYFIPFPGQQTELSSDKSVQFSTSVEPDPYSFDIKVDIKATKSTEAEVSWSGVPYPQDKYVNIYRAIYRTDSGKEDTSTFKIAKRDSPAKTTITDLKPGTTYYLWIEVYLTNGRIKKSNVEPFTTKAGVPTSAGILQQGKLAQLPLHEGDYYGPLVIVAIVASLAILSTLILLMILMKRRSSSKADISPRKTTSAYDNPSYKTCEDAVTITNGQPKRSDGEMAVINQNGELKESV